VIKTFGRSCRAGCDVAEKEKRPGLGPAFSDFFPKD
jgi:hypothetical protein